MVLYQFGHESTMPTSPREKHHITAEEAELIFCYRTLSQHAKAAVISLIASQIALECQNDDAIVRLSLVSKDQA